MTNYSGRNKVSEATAYFDNNADNWDAAARADGYSGIRDRHDVVHLVVRSRTRTRRAIDLGCGTGQLAIELASQGIYSAGLDAAARMVEAARLNANAAASAAVFIHGEVLSDLSHLGSFDLVSAQGLIEYLPLSKIQDFFRACLALLDDGGSLVVGSRNRLFNAVSMNAYTELEHQLGMLPHLIEESLTIRHARDGAQLVDNLRHLVRPWAYPSATPGTGINVSERLQFTPSDLVARLEDIGFCIRAIYPVHFQAVVPAREVGKELAAEGRRLAQVAMVHERQSVRLIPWSSSFVIHATR